MRAQKVMKEKQAETGIKDKFFNSLFVERMSRLRSRKHGGTGIVPQHIIESELGNLPENPFSPVWRLVGMSNYIHNVYRYIMLHRPQSTFGHTNRDPPCCFAWMRQIFLA
jgi:hypothetical protein